MGKVQVNINITKETKDLIEAEAKAEFRSRSAMIEFIIEKYFKEKETKRE